MWYRLLTFLSLPPEKNISPHWIANLITEKNGKLLVMGIFLHMDKHCFLNLLTLFSPSLNVYSYLLRLFVFGFNFIN